MSETGHGRAASVRDERRASCIRRRWHLSGRAVDEERAVPLWLARLAEQDVVLSWVGGYVSANASSLESLDVFLRAPAVPAAAVGDFRTFAAKEGVVVPSDAESNALLQRMLVEAVASARWGDAGGYSVEALVDREIRAAVRALDRARTLQGRARLVSSMINRSI